VEAERRKFDFACELLRDWSRPLVGQTLWNHTAGIDKDVRTMLLDANAEICAYVARDTMQAHRLLSEVMSDFRSGNASMEPHRLKIFWVPQDFDADDEAQRDLIADLLMEKVSRDVLMNVVFGNLTSEDVRFFVRTSGLHGLHLAMLCYISTSHFPDLRPRDLADRFHVSQGAIRERLLRLFGCGFLSQFGGGATLARVTLKGRVFLDLCSELWREHSAAQMGAETLQILRLLGMRYAPSAVDHSTKSLHLAGPLLTEVPEMITGRLIATIAASIERWGVGFDRIEHVVQEDWKPVEDLGSGPQQIVASLRRESGRYSP